jgi:O-antigen/teichoic acid export membrane protein
VQTSLAVAREDRSNHWGQRTATNAIIAVTIQLLKVLIQIATMVCLARLLTPGDYGIFALGMAVPGFASLFVDMGLTAATMVRQELDQSIKNVLFVVNGSMACILTVGCLIFSPIFASLYEDKRLIGLITALSLGVLISGVSLQHRALMIRRMEWGSLGTIEIISLVLSAFLAILLALTTHLGYWCLVVQQLVGASVSAALCWHKCKWRPSRVLDWVKARKALTFGGQVTGYYVLNYFMRQSDNLMIGWYWGAADLGLYSRAYTLIMMPMNIITVPLSAVVVPALARLQSDPAAWRQMFVKTIGGLILITAPISALLILLAEDLVLIVLGSQWTEVAPIFKIFAIAMLVEPLVHSTTWILSSLERGDKLFTAAIMSLSVIIIAFAVGLPWGTRGVALAYSLASIGLLIPRVLQATYGTPVRVVDFVRATVAQYLSAVVALCLALVLREHVTFQNPVTRIGFWTLFVLLVYGISFSVISVQFKTVISVTSTYRFVSQIFSKNGLQRMAGVG